MSSHQLRRTIQLAAAFGTAASIALCVSADAREKYYRPPHPQSHLYLNQDGYQVHRPVYNAVRPEGAAAQCRDGTWSFSQHRRGTCSHHGGVANW